MLSSSPPFADSATASKAEAESAPAPTLSSSKRRHRRASLRRRLILLSVVWASLLLILGGLALDRIVSSTIIRNFDERLEATLPPMLAVAELDSEGEVRFNRSPVDPQFNEPYSGRYWQVASQGRRPFRSRSLWDRELPVDFGRSCLDPCISRSNVFADEPMRIIERDAIIPGSNIIWRFQVAESTRQLDRQLADVRDTLYTSLLALGAGIILLSIIQASIGLAPLWRISRTLAEIRSGRARRVPDDDAPPEVAPLVAELNALLEHNEKVAEEARTHAGNLAHALKTPLSVMTNAAAANAPDLAETVAHELSTMQRHIDHHLARARAMARRASTTSRAEVWPALERLTRAIERIYAERGVVVDLAGARNLVFEGERQDLDEMAGNLIDNAAKYGGGRVFVTVSERQQGGRNWVEILVEDDGSGIPAELRDRMFERGTRLDTEKSGTGLGLAIVRDVAEIYGGHIDIGRSEDLGGMMATLVLPARSDS